MRRWTTREWLDEPAMAVKWVLLFSPQSDIAQIVRNRECPAAPRDDFWNAVAVEVAYRSRDQLCRFVRNDNWSEVLVSVIQPSHHRHGIRIGPIGETAHRDEIDETVTIQISGGGRVGAGQIPDAVKRKATFAEVFQPLNAVPWTGAAN
jgi:hypothetical protein